METHWAAAEKGETDDGLVEAEVLGMGADAEIAGVVITGMGQPWVG